MPKRIFVNNQIRARQVRVIDENGEQLGVYDLTKALRESREKGFDLIQISDKVEPPVCKFGKIGKYLYQIKKKEKQQKSVRTGEIKSIRLGFNISDHDMETQAKKVDKFFKKGFRAKIELSLKGRQKRLGDFGKERLERFLEILKKITPYKIERELKRETRGLTIIIAKESD